MSTPQGAVRPEDGGSIEGDFAFNLDKLVYEAADAVRFEGTSHEDAARREIDRLKAWLLSQLREARKRNEKYIAALADISQGAGRFSRDPLTHAQNCIEDMKQTALDALAASLSQPEARSE